MTTLEQMAVDVFSEGVCIRWDCGLYFVADDEDNLDDSNECEVFSAFDMAQLNDKADYLFEWRKENDNFFEEVEDGPWRLEEG